MRTDEREEAEMSEAGPTLTELPRPPRDPHEPIPRELRVPQVPAPNDGDGATLQERLDEIEASLREIKELLEKVLRRVSGQA